MKLIKCECCGGDEMERQGNSLVCRFCGSTYTLDENEKVVSQSVTDAKVFALYLQAEKFRQAGNILDEIQVLTQAIELDERKATTWVKLGRAFREGNSFDKAIECYNKAIELDPDYAVIYSNIGAIYLIKGNYAKAFAFYEKSLSLFSKDDADYPTTLANYAVVLAKLGDKKKAAQLINEAEKRGYDNAAGARRVSGLSIFSKFFH